MLYRLLVTSLSIALLPAFCKGASSTGTKPAPKSKTFPQLVKEVMDDGWEITLGKDVEWNGTFGFPEGATAYGIDVSSTVATDNKTRLFEVVMDPSTTTARVMGVLMSATSEGSSDTHYEGTWFQAALDGKLQNAMSNKRAGDTQDLKPLEITSPEVKAAYKRELDFWLKGTGRKKKQASKKNAK